jgi:hypothetical protein
MVERTVATTASWKEHWMAGWMGERTAGRMVDKWENQLADPSEHRMAETTGLTLDCRSVGWKDWMSAAKMGQRMAEQRVHRLADLMGAWTAGTMV